jgi:large subunit ribosomal protein L5
MYDFLERLIKLALPRTTDFRGVKRTAFDDQANYHLGIKEQLIFPEIDAGNVDGIRPWQCTIVTSTKDKKQAFRLLELLGLPFTKDK